MVPIRISPLYLASPLLVSSIWNRPGPIQLSTILIGD